MNPIQNNTVTRGNIDLAQKAYKKDINYLKGKKNSKKECSIYKSIEIPPE